MLMGGLTCREVYMLVKKGNREDRHHETKLASLLEKMKKVHCIICCFTHQENRNQGIHTGWLIHGGTYMRGAYTWSKTSVTEKEGLSVCVCGGGGGGGL